MFFSHPFHQRLFLPAACVGLCEREVILTGLRLGASRSITVWKTRFFHQLAAEPPFIEQKNVYVVATGPDSCTHHVFIPV